MVQAAESSGAQPQRLREHRSIEAVRAEIGRVIVGQQALVDRLLVALLTNNHALVEGVPGLAKTLTVSTLANALECSFARIQFTPDLLPADVTGTLVFNPQEGGFHVRRGPIFVNVVLADEINRAPAKVQSALLEAMQERTVSIGGQSLPLPDPFLVLATQNPIEQEGTYPLPEAQLDRFMMKIVVRYPEREEEREILARALDQEPQVARSAVSIADIAQLREAVRDVDVNDRLREYIVRLVEASREPERYRMDDLKPFIEFGASPRAGIFLARGAQAYAFIHGRDYVTPQDIKEIAPDVLRHRLVLTYEAEARGVTADEVVTRLLEGVGIPLGRRHMSRPAPDDPLALSAGLLGRVRGIEIRTRRFATSQVAGNYRSVFRGSGIEFAEAREYVPGDDVRRIDWNVTARMGTPWVKEYVEERDLTVICAVDRSASMLAATPDAGRLRAAAEIVALLGFSAAYSNDRTGLLAFSDGVDAYIEPKRGTRHVLRLVHDVLRADIAPGRGTSMAPALDHLSRVLRRRSVVFLVSDFFTSGYAQPLQTLARHHDVVAVVLTNPLDAALPDVGLLDVADAETGTRFVVDTSNAGVRERYAAAAGARSAARDTRLSRSGVDRIDVRLGHDVAEPIAEFFRRRAQVMQ